jgi:putative DNA methylase
VSNIRSPKKLIEVALPLDDINSASAREKSIRHGHPSTLHLWWARRPLAAARAVIFAQMVNDPGGERGYYAGKTKAQADAERERLFELMRELVQWENTNNADVLARARAEIAKSWRETCELNRGKPGFDPEQLPAFHDPFAGGGTLPLEAQRLGLQSFASDLNPVAVTINKAMIEIPPKFAGRAPVGPVVEGERGTKKANEDWTTTWTGAQGLAEDVRRYGAWMREQALQRIGQLYPSVTVTADMLAANEAGLDAHGHKRHLNQGLAGLQAGQELTVIAWLWARTVKSPNPAFSHVDVPLASTFILSSKPGKEAYVLPVVEGDSYRFEVRTGTPPAEAKEGTKISRGAFRCLFSDAPIKYEYIDAEANAGRMGSKLMAIVAEGQRGRIYLAPIPAHEATAAQALPSWKPETACRGTFASNAQGRIYGFKVFGDYFTPRQLAALTTFSDLVAEAIARVRVDALISTDPPYYDNIGYADLSDFFYVWLRRSLRPVFPDLLARSPCPRPRSWSPRPTATAARRRLRRSSGRHDAGDAQPARRAGAPGLPGHHLLRLQAERDQGRRWHPQHRLGDFPGGGAARRLRHHRHLADAH